MFGRKYFIIILLGRYDLIICLSSGDLQIGCNEANMSNNKKIGSSNTYLRLFDSADFFFSHHPIPTTCLLWHCNFLNDERFAMQDKSKEKNLNQNSTIILNVDKISSTLLRNVLINLNHYILCNIFRQLYDSKYLNKIWDTKRKYIQFSFPNIPSCQLSMQKQK